MASFLFICRKCLSNVRVVAADSHNVYVPDDFDFLCNDCRSEPAEKEIRESDEGGNMGSAQSQGLNAKQRGRVAASVSDGGDTAGEAVPAAAGAAEA